MGNDRAANSFLTLAIQEWGQPEEEGVKAVQGLIDAAGFDATAHGWPVFGGIWSKPCTGKDGAKATAWLKELTDNLKRGRYQEEVAQINEALAARVIRAA